MRKCRYSERSAGSGGSHLAIAIIAIGLGGCAALAGIDDSPVIERGSQATPARTTTPPAAPTTPDDALKGNEKENTDSNATDIAVAVSALDFKKVYCNAESPPQSIVIANTSATARPFAVVMPEGTPFYSNDPLSGTLPANGNVIVKVFAKPAAAGIATANVVVTSGASFVTVPVGVVGVGGVLEWATQLADIGETPVNTEGTTKVFLKNIGTADAMVTSFAAAAAASSPFSAGPNNLAIPAGDQREVTLKLAKGGVTSKLQDVLRPIAEGLCVAPSTVTVTGQRVDNTVTVTSADWGKRDCNSTTNDQRNVLIRNYSNKTLQWTLKTLPQSYQLVGAVTTGTVAAAAGAGSPGQATIAFTAPAFGATLGSLTESVTVAIENYNGSALTPPAIGDRQVTLKSDVRGAIVALSATELTFVAATGKNTTKSLKVTNTGNEPARIRWAFARTAGEPAWTGLPGTTYTSGGNTSNINLGYTPSSEPPNTATLTPSRDGGGKICNPEALTVVNMIGQLPP